MKLGIFRHLRLFLLVENQKRNLASRLLNIILALLIITSSTGFVINQHYCQGELKETAFMVKAKTCHDRSSVSNHSGPMANMPANCPMHQTNNPSSCEEKKDCCNDETEFVKLDIDQEISSFKLPKIYGPVMAAILVFSYQMDYLSPNLSPVPYLNYKPPLIVCDMPASLQTFLL